LFVLRSFSVGGHPGYSLYRPPPHKASEGGLILSN